jgi:putative lipoic acid-binding regulatory protein
MEPERITFPAEYPIKVIARAGAGLRERLEANPVR